ncbi:MAG: hypothetical protein JNK00_09525 [Flavipsychrobacter sp.]|nr:hypothetical protein [Flavipsychrobacter sp.]
MPNTDKIIYNTTLAVTTAFALLYIIAFGHDAFDIYNSNYQVGNQFFMAYYTPTAAFRHIVTYCVLILTMLFLLAVLWKKNKNKASLVVCAVIWLTVLSSNWVYNYLTEYAESE